MVETLTLALKSDPELNRVIIRGGIADFKESWPQAHDKAIGALNDLLSFTDLSIWCRGYLMRGASTIHGLVWGADAVLDRLGITGESLGIFDLTNKQQTREFERQCIKQQAATVLETQGTLRLDSLKSWRNSFLARYGEDPLIGLTPAVIREAVFKLKCDWDNLNLGPGSFRLNERDYRSLPPKERALSSLNDFLGFTRLTQECRGYFLRQAAKKYDTKETFETLLESLGGDIRAEDSAIFDENRSKDFERALLMEAQLRK